MDLPCDWTSWLWECRKPNENFTWFEAPVIQGAVSYRKAMVYGWVGSMGLIMNILALVGLDHCQLTYSTLILMKLQCLMNVFGLLAKTIVNPIVCVTGRPFPPIEYRFFFQIPGAFLVLAIYGQFALQSTMAINRLVAFCYRHRVPFWFNEKRSNIYATLAVCHGVWNLLMCMFPCCPCYFDHILHKWGYTGWGTKLRQKMTITSDVICCSIMIYCYSRTFIRLKCLRNQVSDVSTREMRREMRILLQFFTVACTWLGYSLCYRPVYYVQAVRTSPEAMVVSELVRFWMFSVDPVIYFIFMKRLRNYIFKKVFNSNLGQALTSGPAQTTEKEEDRKIIKQIHQHK